MFRQSMRALEWACLVLARKLIAHNFNISRYVRAAVVAGFSGNLNDALAWVSASFRGTLFDFGCLLAPSHRIYGWLYRIHFSSSQKMSV